MSPQSEPTPERFPGSRAETVLLVEDEFLVRMYGVDVLEEAGYRVLEAADAAGALTMLEADPSAVSVLVTDIQLPGSVDGRALARIVDGRWPWIRIVMTSGEVRLSADDVPDHGRFLSKPWAGEAMLRAIRAAGHSSSDEPVEVPPPQ
jgi:CheY-like chemotaxis protein